MIIIMVDNFFMNKMILVNLVYMYKQINGEIPPLKKLEDIISKINVEIDQNYVKDFLEKLQKIDFQEAELNGRKQIEFIKKQKPIILYKPLTIEQINLNTEKKETISDKKEKVETEEDNHSYSGSEDLLPDLFDD